MGDLSNSYKLDMGSLYNPVRPVVTPDELRKKAAAIEKRDRERKREAKCRERESARRRAAHRVALDALLAVAKYSTDDNARVTAAVEILSR
jgi:hypothetical protein